MTIAKGLSGRGSGCKDQFAETVKKAWIDHRRRRPGQQAVTASLVRQSLVMSPPSASMQDLARRLVALEATSQTPSESGTHAAAIRVSEKLRISLTRFAGADGFTALLRRAVSLARAHVPPLEAVKVKADGRLEGFDEFAAQTSNSGTDGATAILAPLLELLVTFIGEPLTLQLLREAWPDLSLDEWHSRSKTL